MIIFNILFAIVYIPFLILMLPYMLIKAALTKPAKNDFKQTDFVDIDTDTIANHLSEAVKCKTVSMQHPETDDGSEFLKYHKLLEEMYPTVHKKAEKTVINDYSLVYKIEGSDASLLPACFLAHQDVVPAPPEGWEVAPFEGVIKDNYVYGRGAQDMKCQFITLLEGVEAILKNDGLPKRTIYLCFGHDEEISTANGAPKIVEYFKEKGIKMEYVVDEGGAMLDGQLLGVTKTIALIGTCEKGQSDYIIKADIDGGHGSMPDTKTSLGEVVKATNKILKNPLPSKWNSATLDLFDSIAPYAKYVMRIVFANRKLLSPVLKLVLAKASTITRSLVCSTFAPTMAKGSDAPNVIPGTASLNINVRIIPGQDIEQIKNHMQKTAGKNVTVLADPQGTEATAISPITSYGFKELEKAILQTFEGVIAAPYMFVAGTDAKYYYPICDNVLRFTPFMFSEDDRTRIHAKNERCFIPDLPKATKFFGIFIKNTCY